MPPLPPVKASDSRAARLVLLVTAIGLISLNLRPALTSPGPLLSEIMREFGIDTALAGGVTGISLICLGVFGAAAPRLARRFGPERVILALLVVLAAGIALRGTGSFGALIGGMILAGLGIGVIQVLLPGIVKRDFARHAGTMTGLYTMNLCLGAAIGAGLAIPLEQTLGSWRLSLAAWALPALAAAIIWLPQAFVRQSPAPRAARPGRLWRDPLAWAVTCFMGLQSCLAYMMIGLMPLILEQRGDDSARAGLITAIAIAPQALTALAVPHFAARMRNQSAVAIVSIAVSAIGFLGLLFAPPSTALLFAVIEGLGLGATIGIAILFIVLRAPDSHVATDLSGMSQSVGYIIAALGPIVAGLLRDAGGNWVLPAAFFLAVASLNAVAGWYAGRDAHVLQDPES
ncbi:MFS transporter [Microbaculum marinum]|uniref:MFS transporter n=1 Tax=Microbaculum marinum TaxID=1764581 RepID=A0AAW9RZA4_9HYPH